MKKLVENGIIERKGGKRFGYWEILKQKKLIKKEKDLIVRAYNEG